jgi:hypothetical protein
VPARSPWHIADLRGITGAIRDDDCNDNEEKCATFSRFLLAVSILATAASIVKAAEVYRGEAEANRAQRQCALYLEAMKQPDISKAVSLQGLYDNEYQPYTTAEMLAEMLNMQPASRQYCYFPDYHPSAFFRP